MATDHTAFAASGEDAIARALDVHADTTADQLSQSEFNEYYEITRTAEEIIKGDYKRIALQFPDELLHASVPIYRQLKAKIGEDRELYVLADTSYGRQAPEILVHDIPCCVDEVAAQHADVHAVVHYGHACMTQTSRLPVIYVFGQKPFDVSACITSVVDFFTQRVAEIGQKGDLRKLNAILLRHDVGYTHTAESLYQRLQESFQPLGINILYERIATSTQPASPNFAEVSFTSTQTTQTQSEPGSSSEQEPQSESSNPVLLYIGGESLTLTNLLMTHGLSEVFHYDPATQMTSLASGRTNRLLMRRYAAVQRARDADVFGILVGTLGVASYLPLIRHLRTLLSRNRKKSYTISVGKLNPSKLANFLEIECFILVACPENSVIEAKEFLRPIVTPFEVEIALQAAPSWTGRYILDFERLLAESAGPDALDGQPDSASADVDSPSQDGDNDPDQPVFSLITGTYRHAKRYGAGAGGNSQADDVAGGDSAVVLRNQDDSVVKLADSAAGLFLQTRTYQGLETRVGEDAPSVLEQGRSGIARGYRSHGAHHENQNLVRARKWTSHSVKPLPHPLLLPSHKMASASPDSTTLIERAQSFLSEHKRAVLLGTAAALAVGGVAYYAATSSRPRGQTDVEKAPRKDKKKGGKGKKKKSVKDADGPVLEEREQPKAKVEDDDALPDTPLTAEQIAAMSTEERTRLAAAFKERGNAAYKERRFAQAAVLYTRAIEVTPKPEPVFYSNRAACYVNMQPPQHAHVVEDCDVALKLDSNYVKALNRRAIALEGLERFEEALRDFTAATILDKFSNQTTAQAVERVLQKLATKKAAEILRNREPRLPSFTFISAYFAAFRPRPHPELPENPSTGDETFRLGLQALDAADYAHALTFIGEAIEQGISWDEGRAEALNLRGTFKFLTGDVPGAKADLLASLAVVPRFTQSLVKLASVHMEQGDPAAAFQCFDDAIKVDERDPDIYYHRGQVLFIMNEFTQAAENYTKSTELDDSFVFTHIQLAVAQYKSGNLANSMATFRRTLKAFPQRSEPHNYYGELLLDQQRYEDAVEKFERAAELELLKAPPNVLPLVNKGLAMYQWKQDIGAAERCCAEALRIDPDCEAAVATLAQLSLQQSKIEKAVEYFERQADLARSEPELVNALTYQFASASQVEFLKNYPQMASQLSALARGM
ncbi:hypothetical protein D9615_008664 [Tricholomella constricta]|uniref:2-(3-amino-3-carboxypropyl)histidine synthase subunit 2 n=1 Tax=Tricholomella constricta TaxID=117010 RepID=A0A8H5H4N9_9AGAR|nr:hypothetical protein D9615_008664 [Tricholomella constricta]